MIKIVSLYYQLINLLTPVIRNLQGIVPLAIRLYLVPVFWMAGTHKLASFQDTVDWFGNTEYGLGLPFPWLMASLATLAELGGAILLAAGLATRWISIPLIVTMVVAMTTVHWEYGWQAVADPSAPFSNSRISDAAEKLAQIKTILQQYADYDNLTSSGHLVILNNGIEFAATYLILLVALIFLGGGRYVSADYWLNRFWRKRLYLPAQKKNI